MTSGLFLLQRLTALLMAPLVLGHLAVMIYAVKGGLSASEILGRTKGSIPWALFYGCFVLAVSVHAAIGLRVIALETLRIHKIIIDLFSIFVCIGLLVVGLCAVLSVTVL